MTTRDYRNEKEWNEWLAKRYEGKRSVCVVINLLPCRIHDGAQEWLSDDIIHKTANRFRNKINHHYYGKTARRYGKGLIITGYLHKEPHKHLHCVVSIPENESLLKFKSVIDDICLKDGWMKPLPYIGETENQKSAQNYNSRNGSDSLIIF